MDVRIQDSGSFLVFFQSLQLKKEDVVFISSDLGQLAKSCRANNERIDLHELIETLQGILTDGTIVIPAYTDDLLSGDTFDWVKSKPTTGALSNKVQKRNDFIRTRDPLHSVFVWGKHQQEVLGLDDESTFGSHSIFSFLKKVNAKFIFIDIHIQECFTYIHFIEEQLQVPYRKSYTYTIDCVYPEGTMKRNVKFYSKRLGVTSDINDLHAVLMHDQVYQIFQFRDSYIHILEAQTVWTYAVKSIHKGPKLYKYSLFKHLKDVIKRYVLRRKGIF
jgi:aminoglycoside 3-N-acetyltransferase